MAWLRYFAASDDPGSPPPSGVVRAFNFVLALLVISLVFFFSFQHLAYHMHWSSLYPYRALFWQGWLVTIVLSAAALILSLAIGLISALAGRSRLLPMRYLDRIYVEVIRGTPLLVQILIFFYVVADAVGVDNRYEVGVLTLAVFSGAYISE